MKPTPEKHDTRAASVAARRASDAALIAQGDAARQARDANEDGAVEGALALPTWRQMKATRLREIDTASIRPMRTGDAVRLKQLETFAATVRVIDWNGEGDAPVIPPVPAHGAAS